MDRILLRGLQTYARHGVLDQERVHGQPFIVDLDLELDLQPAGRSDDLAQTVDYSAVSQSVIDLVAAAPVKLIETLAERIALLCLSQPRVLAVKVVVHKPKAPIGVPFTDVSVMIERRKDE